MFDYGGTGGDSEKPAGFPPTHDPNAASGNGFTPVSPVDDKPPADVEGEFLVPANMVPSPTTAGGTGGAGPPPKGPGGRKGRVHHHHVAVPGDMDDYFKEGEEKSREEDYGASVKPGSAVPPPPKMGGGGMADAPRAETRSPAPVEAGDSDS
jgi:hypothetical protein